MCRIWPTTVTDEDVAPLQARIQELRDLYGEVYTGHQAKRLMCTGIAAVIETGCRLCGGVTILLDEVVQAESVHQQGRFDFTLKHGDKRIAIVAARHDGIKQGMAEMVAGLKALADVKRVDTAYGIVTN